MSSVAANEEIDRALAVLISSTKRKRRPLPLTEISKALSVARGHLGTTAAVARAIGLSGKMLGQFSRVDDLEPTARRLVANRIIDSVDTVVQLAQLTAAEQQVVASAIAAKELDSKDVRAVVEMRKRGIKKNVNEILERVKTTKTRRQYVIEFIIRSGLSDLEIKKRLQRFVPTVNIVDVTSQGTTGRIILDEAGYAAFKNEAKRQRVTPKQLATLLTTERWDHEVLL